MRTVSSDALVLTFPRGVRFASVVIDDTDVATLDNMRPMSRLFKIVGMREALRRCVTPGERATEVTA